MKTVNEMSTEEIEQMLAERKKEENKAREEARKEYEQKRDELVLHIVNKCSELAEQLKNFKGALHEIFNEQAEKLSQYGNIRSNSKGGFSLFHSNGEIKVTRVRNTQPVWDERSVKAVELIKDFLSTTIKKRDKKLFEILYSFVQKNDKGELEYSKVMHLFQHKNKYDDPRWREGLELIAESYTVHLRGYGYVFSRKNNQGKWENIEINFTAL